MYGHFLRFGFQSCTWLFIISSLCICSHHFLKMIFAKLTWTIWSVWNQDQGSRGEIGCFNNWLMSYCLRHHNFIDAHGNHIVPSFEVIQVTTILFINEKKRMLGSSTSTSILNVTQFAQSTVTCFGQLLDPLRILLTF